MRPITERLSPVIKFLVLANGLLYAFYVLVEPAKRFIATHLALTAATLRGEAWQPLTSLFVHLEGMFIIFLFNVIGLWWVGATVERQVGTRRFLTIFFVSGVVSNLVMVLVSAWLGMPVGNAGPGNAVLALFISFGVLFYRQQVGVWGALVMDSRIITWLLIGFTIFADLARGQWQMLSADIVAMLLGYLMVPGIGQRLRRSFTSARAKRSRRRYQVLEGGRGQDKPPFLN